MSTKEPTVAREGGVMPLNAVSNEESRLRKMSFVKIRNTLRKSDELMPSPNVREKYDNLATKTLKRSKMARKDFLHHANNKDELLAARYIWNHIEELQHTRTSPFGEGKDAVKDKENLDKKKENGIIQFEEYRFSYRQKDYKVKTARYKNSQETLYHIQKVKR